MEQGQHTSLDAVLANADCLFSEREVNSAIAKVAVAMVEAFADKHPLVLTVMNGGMIFTSQLLLQMPIALELDYLHVTRYRNTHTGSDQLDWLHRPQRSLLGRHVVVVDDILDEGLTLQAIQQYCCDEGAASVATAVLVEKIHERRVPQVSVDFCALQVPDRYVFGCGMDTQGLWRNLPAIYAYKAS